MKIYEILRKSTKVAPLRPTFAEYAARKKDCIGDSAPSPKPRPLGATGQVGGAFRDGST